MTGRLCRDGAMLRRRIGFLAALCLQLGLLAACAKPGAPPLPPSVEMPYGQGRIWKIEGQDIQPSYVFGTLHVSDPRVLSIPSSAEEAFNKAQIAAFEAVEPPGEEEERFTEDRITLPQGTTTRGLLGNSAWGKLVSIYKSRGYWRPRDDIKPWVFWDYLGGARSVFYGNDRKKNPDHPILDDWLEERARKAGKEVIGLETSEESFAIFDGMPMDIQVSLLQTAIDHYYEYTYGIPRVQLYLDGDLAQSRAIWEQSLSRLDPEAARTLDDRLINDRNRVMVERMLPLMQRGSTFVGVGAGHMGGEKGILRLLEQRGYVVTRLQ